MDTAGAAGKKRRNDESLTEVIKETPKLDEDGFQIVPSKRHKKSAYRVNPAARTLQLGDTCVLVRNVQNNSNPSTQHQSQGTSTEPRKKGPSPPPIFIYGNDFVVRGLQSKLQEILKETIRISVNQKSQTLLRLKSDEDYKKAIDFLKSEGITFHHHPLASEQNLKLAIKGLHPDLPTEEVEDELRLKGFLPIRTIRMKKREKNGELKNLPAVIVLLHNTKANKELKGTSYLGAFRVKIEDYRGRSIPLQCFSCQSYGHMQRGCFRPPQCRICAGAHDTRSCNQDPHVVDPTCTNCGQKHVANSKECPHYKQALESLKKTGGKKDSKKTEGKSSYAAVARGGRKRNSGPRRNSAPSNDFDIQKIVEASVKAVLASMASQKPPTNRHGG